MSDASFVNFLQSELLLLSNEIKKKYPEIKEVNPPIVYLFFIIGSLLRIFFSWLGRLKMTLTDPMQLKVPECSL